jgi:hypothetical protein
MIANVLHVRRNSVDVHIRQRTLMKRGKESV